MLAVQMAADFWKKTLLLKKRFVCFLLLRLFQPLYSFFFLFILIYYICNINNIQGKKLFDKLNDEELRALKLQLKKFLRFMKGIIVTCRELGDIEHRERSSREVYVKQKKMVFNG